jgi:hypothetical protein
VLVDHLGDGVAEKDHILVERLDVPLQLDAVDQVDRDGNMLFSQQVQERVLKKLTFVAHDMLRDEK